MIGKDTRSADILRFLYEYTADNYGRSPSSREIASAVGLSSTNSVHIYLKRLVEAGYIELVDGGARNIRIVGAWYSNPPLPDELAAQYNEGYTTRDLGDLYGVSQRTITTWLKRSPDYAPRQNGVKCSKLLSMKPQHPCAVCEIDLDHPDMIRIGDKCLYCAEEELRQKLAEVMSDRPGVRMSDLDLYPAKFAVHVARSHSR